MYDYIGGRLLAAQLLHIVIILSWTSTITGMVLYFWGLKRLGVFQVAPEIEVDGLDVSPHGGSTYSILTEQARGLEESPNECG
jgi:ammonia channel protein AmtB